ncbi:MAG: glycosyltransferase [Atopobiaceae bacterium]|nr:glycosyltransferase [Atopobiaceae bacterium]
MAEKLLTVSVAVYKVEEYLEQCLESCCVPQVVDYLDVIVVIDGSPDGSAEIARGYAERYPDSFRVVEKENGGYGTTVNTSMGLARGKYFRLLDGDDWFDRDGLVKLIDVLRGTDADWVVSPRMSSLDGVEATLDSDSFADRAGETLTPDEIDQGFFVGMWMIAVKLDLIKRHPFTLPGRMSYTDQLFIVKTLAYVEKVRFTDFGVYCYRVGREGQTIAPEVRLKNLDNLLYLHYQEMDFFNSDSSIAPGNRKLLATRMGASYSALLKVHLMLPFNTQTWNRIKRLEEDTHARCKPVYEAAARNRLWMGILRAAGHLGYWAFLPIDLHDMRYWTSGAKGKKKPASK